MQLTRLVVIYGFPFTEAIEKVLTESPSLGMHTGIVHLAWRESADGVEPLKSCKYIWMHCDCQPWGQLLPIQCPSCRTVQKWHSIYLDDGSYKFKCTYSRCGYCGADREGWKHQIIIQRPQGVECSPSAVVERGFG